MQRKPDVETTKDGRVILRNNAYKKMKCELRRLAGCCCEKCGRRVMNGDVEHRHGRGGGRRDDRIFVNGKRNLFYWCRECHTPRHSPPKVCPPKPEKLSDAEFRELLGI
jgi:hypothetical protein